jgi:hypothetical protein
MAKVGTAVEEVFHDLGLGAPWRAAGFQANDQGGNQRGYDHLSLLFLSGGLDRFH